ncbi:anaerobic sulfite reductase subunit AsrB [Halanaerobaculum tunisiense]
MCDECKCIAENELKPKPCPILDIEQETNMEYKFRVATDMTAQPGQFFQISLPKVGEAPISVSGIGDDWLEFTIRKVGKVTGEVFGLQTDDNLFIRGPYGNSFPVDEFADQDLVIIAGGTGVCAVKSLLQHAYDNYEQLNSVHFLTGFKNTECILYSADLEKYEEKFDNTIYSLDEEEAAGFETGFVTEYIEQVPFASLDDYQVVIVGPQVMMDAAAAECLEQGVSEEKIWLSLERNMSCGVGKCGHCKIGDTYVCVDGPVFNYTTAKDLID